MNTFMLYYMPFLQRNWHLPGLAPMMGIPVPPGLSPSAPAPTGLPATPVPPVLILI